MLEGKKKKNPTCASHTLDFRPCCIFTTSTPNISGNVKEYCNTEYFCLSTELQYILYNPVEVLLPNHSVRGSRKQKLTKHMESTDQFGFQIEV